MSQQEVVLLLGSNLGNGENNIELALELIHAEIGDVLDRTEIVKTIPVEFVSNNIFCNSSVLIKTQFSPLKLLDSLKLIEYKMGRVEDTLILGAYQDRIIDIDIVLYGNLAFWSKDLQIPHQKHLYQRDFSMKLLNVLTNIKKQ